MATRKSSAGDARSSGLPAEPEVTRSAMTGSTPGASNPGREPAHLAAARARRQRDKEQAMRREYQQYQQSPCASGSALSSGLKIIGGASLGAALMYLLDPEAGERRREEARLRAARAAATTGTVLGNVADLAGNVAGNVWDLSTEAGRAMAARAAQAGATGAAAASNLGSSFAERAGETAHSVGEGARRQARSARHTAAGWFGHEEEKQSHVPESSTVASAAIALAAGVGMMYLLDPADGARRRALIGQKATRFFNETGEFCRRTGRHLANRSRGVAHDTRSMFQRGGEPSDDRTVAERIRARLGHLQRPGADVAVAVLDGRCTITGRCTADDVDAVLTCVQSTPGVSSVVNLLTVQSPGASERAGSTGSLK